MAVLNYTTQIDAAKTIGEIQGMLATHGALAVGVEYDNGEPARVGFTIRTPDGTRAYQLPANVDAMHRLLVQQDKQGKLKSLSQAVRTSRAQATRVAWRVVKDWLEAQLAMIETQMAPLDQVMLPYLSTGEGRTLYDDFREQRLAITTGGA